MPLTDAPDAEAALYRPDQTGARPRLMILVTEDWYVCSHRLPLIRAAIEQSLDVTVVTRVRDHAAAIRQTGASLVALGWRRGTINPLEVARDIVRIMALYRQHRPTVVHHVAIKPALLGGIAALLAGVPVVVTTLAGRGAALSGNGPTAKLGGAVLRTVLRLLELRRQSGLVVQNEDDLEWSRQWPSLRRVNLIRGSGVDLASFQVLDEPSGRYTVAQVSRMLTIKGVETVVEAVSRLRLEGLEIDLILAGDSDPESRAAISEDRLREWSGRPGIYWLGRVADVRTVWSRAHVAVLGSLGGEGVPKSLLEAAACGRPIVATDVPGSREVARDGENAVLVPPGDVSSLASALRRLAEDPALRRRLAAESRCVVEPEFGDGFVADRTVAIYRDLLAEIVPYS